MEWIYKNEKWSAVGDRGDFLIWKIHRGFYRARYRSKDGKQNFFLGYGSVSEMKSRCERNYYWE